MLSKKSLLGIGAIAVGLIFLIGCAEDTVAVDQSLPVHTDVNVRAFEGAGYIIERGSFSNIIKIRVQNPSIISANVAVDFSEATAARFDIATATFSELTRQDVIYQVHIGDATNIHDIAFISSTKAYVTQYDAAEVALFNPQNGQVSSKKINLARYSASGATTPNMDAALYHQGKVYIALQKLKNYSVTATSSVVVIDAAADTVIKEIILTMKNPQGMSVLGNTLYVSCTGAYGLLDGGVERIDMSMDTTMGALVEERTLGGDISNVVVLSASRGYVVAADAKWDNKLIPFNPTTGTTSAAVGFVTKTAPSAVAFNAGVLYVAERDTVNPGLKMVNDQNALSAGPFAFELPLYALAYVEGQ